MVVVIHFLQDNMHMHSFSSVFAVKLGQLIQSQVWCGNVPLTMIGLNCFIPWLSLSRAIFLYMYRNIAWEGYVQKRTFLQCIYLHLGVIYYDHQPGSVHELVIILI